MLKPLSPLTCRPPQNDREYTVTFDGFTCRVEDGGRPVLIAGAEAHQDTLRLRLEPLETQDKLELVLGLALDVLLGHHPEIKNVKVVDPSGHDLSITRGEFYQNPAVWHRRGGHVQRPEEWTTTQGRRHPVRETLVPGTFYRRYVAQIQKTLSLRTIDAEADLDLFHGWHHQPRVYDLWELNKPKDELRTYLQKALADAHSIPMILEADGKPVGYFEFYWGAEDRLAPYYESEPYDRGLHLLIGEPSFLGVENTNAALRSVTHFLFLEDARTQRLVAEPRSDNQRILKYVQIVPGWRFVKEFDFPHKRAALLMASRELFFNGVVL